MITLALRSCLSPRIGQIRALEATVIGLDVVVGVPLRAVPGRWQQSLQHRRVHRRLIGGDLDRCDLGRPDRPLENRWAAVASRRADTNTSMICPNWSTARYT